MNAAILAALAEVVGVTTGQPKRGQFQAQTKVVTVYEK